MKISPDELLTKAAELKDAGFDMLEDVTAVDYKDRFEINYRLRNVASGEAETIKIDLSREEPVVPSLVPLYRGAEFQEREVFDLMGIVFEGHPDLRRILLPDDWEGHPLRKDYVID